MIIYRFKIDSKFRHKKFNIHSSPLVLETKHLQPRGARGPRSSALRLAKPPGTQRAWQWPGVQLGDPVLRLSTPQRALGWGPAAVPRHVVSFHLPLSSKGLELNHQPPAGPTALCTWGQGSEQHPWGSPCSTSLGAVQGPLCLALGMPPGAPEASTGPSAGPPASTSRAKAKVQSGLCLHFRKLDPIPVGWPRVPGPGRGVCFIGLVSRVPRGGPGPRGQPCTPFTKACQEQCHRPLPQTSQLGSEQR